MKTLIIGGGASGFAAAIAAAKKGDDVLILERERKPLRKLAVTGNGRGNLLNCGEPRYFGDVAFAKAVLADKPWTQVAVFLNDCGIALVHEEEGRMYPACFLASAAVDALKLRAQALGVGIKCNAMVTRLEKSESGFGIFGTKAVYAPDIRLKSGRIKQGDVIGEEAFCEAADRVIVAVGGAASPVYGTDGSSYGLLTAFGHELIAPHPALCALTSPDPLLHELSGQRVRARLLLTDASDHKLGESQGEVLFARDGISGIAAMQLSRFAHCGCTLHMDIRPTLMGNADQSAITWLSERPAHMDETNVLTGAAHPALAKALLIRAGGTQKLPSVIEDFTFSVSGTRGFENAQVTAGGIRCDGFDAHTMESKLCKDLYACAEVLDVDGECGGYNLLFAFASGLIAGEN